MQYLRANHQRIMTCEEILEIFLHIFNHHDKRSGVKNSNADRWIDFSVNYINTHLHTQIKIKEIADLVGVSSTYLLHIFKIKFGLSPKQYISRLKLHTAKKLLTETSLSITEVSNSVGFQDVLTFSRFFSSKEGISPTGYRKQHQ